MTLLSRVSGLARDIVFANLIGAGANIGADAFYVAFRIPNFFRRMFGEGAFSQAFIPVFAEYRANKSHAETRLFVNRVGGMLSAALFLVTGVGVFAAPLLVLVLASGFVAEPAKYELTVHMLRIMFPYLFFVSLVAMAAGILNTFGRFGAAAFTPVLLNVCLIAAALWVGPELNEPVVALAWGVLAAGALQLLFQIPFLRNIDMLPRPSLKPRERHEGVARVFKLMIPAIFGVSVAQLNMLINTWLASFLVTGSISWLWYSDRLMEFPLGVFGIALATVILPALSKRHANESREDFSQLLDWALRWVFIIGVPASVALVVLAGPMITTLFNYGAFTARDVVMSSHALIAFALGLPGLILVKVLAPGFYARQDTKTPVRIGAISMGVNAVLSVALVYPLAHTGLALAISVAAIVNAGLLYRLLRRHGVYQPLPGWALYIARVLLASTVMGMLLYWGTGDLSPWLAAPAQERVARLFGWITAGSLTYLIAIVLLGIRPKQLLLVSRNGISSKD